MAATTSLQFSNSLRSVFGVKIKDCIYEDDKVRKEAPIKYLLSLFVS